MSRKVIFQEDEPSDGLPKEHLSSLIDDRSFLNFDHSSPSLMNLMNRRESPSYPEVAQPSYLSTEISDEYCNPNPVYKHLLEDLKNHKSSVYSFKNEDTETESHDADEIKKKWEMSVKRRREKRIKERKISTFFGENRRPVLPRCGFMDMGDHELTTSDSD